MRVDPVLWGQGVAQAIQLSLIRKIQHICKRYKEQVVLKFSTSTRGSGFCRRDQAPHGSVLLSEAGPASGSRSAIGRKAGSGVDALNGGVEAQNGALEGLQTKGRRFASL